MDDRSRIRGFSLIEVMVALAVMAIVITHVLILFTVQNKAYVAQDRNLEVQQNARLVMSQVLADIRIAGLLVPAIAGVASVDGGPNAPVRIVVVHFGSCFFDRHKDEDPFLRLSKR